MQAEEGIPETDTGAWPGVHHCNRALAQRAGGGVTGATGGTATPACPGVEGRGKGIMTMPPAGKGLAGWGIAIWGMANGMPPCMPGKGIAPGMP